MKQLLHYAQKQGVSYLYGEASAGTGIKILPKC